MNVVNLKGAILDFDAAVQFMDDEIREELHGRQIDGEQEFFTAYEKAHAEKFDEEWEPSKANPVW